MKIAVIGPTYPFTGGVSHYNTELCKHLSTKHEIILITYKRRFPSFLYPGRNQIDTSSAKKNERAYYMLDTLNPKTWIDASLRIRKENANLLIFHWITPFMALMFLVIFFLLKKIMKIKVLGICHNVLPHERTLLDLFLTKMAFRYVDYFIVHSRNDLKILKEITGKPIKLSHLPTYNMFNFTGIQKSQARELLNLRSKDRIILFFGYIRGYKGLIYLIRAMPKVLKMIPTALLLIVGEFWENKEKYLTEIRKFNIEDSVVIVDEYVPDELVEVYFSAADVVVLPYVSATQSAIVQIAYAFNKPVIATNVGGLTDVIEDNKTGIIVEPRNPNKLAEAIIFYLNRNKEYKFRRNIQKIKERFSWDKLIEIIDKLGE